MGSRISDKEFETRFWESVCQRSKCWLWKGKYSWNGYGAFHGRVNGQILWSAHRYSWALHHGPIPDGLCVLHSCDNRFCVNPDHLRVGTQAENQAESVARGRSTRGERNRNAKLTEQDIRDIRDSDSDMNELATQYDVHPTHIYNIIQRKKWGHIE